MRLFLIVLSFLCPAFSSATTWYVSNGGSNSNDGMSPGNAFLTIQFAEDMCSAGDSVIVENGSYEGFYVDVSGTASDPIVFYANGSSVAITSPTSTTDGINIEGVEGATVDYIEINGFIVNDMPRNGIRLVWANHCTVRNCLCDGNFERGILTGFTDDILIEYNECSNSIDEHGIYVSNSSDRSILRYNECHHNHGGGIQINADASLGGDGIATDPEIYGNVIYENGNGGGAGINLDGVQGAFIYNNLLYENHATGIALFQIDGGGPSINAVVVHNTIIQASNGRWCLLIVDGATGAQVYNNILINQHPFRGSIAVSANSFSGMNSNYNLVIDSFSDDGGDQSFIDLEAWQALGYDLNSFLADPIVDIFIDPAGGDYHLLEEAQPIDAGNGELSQGVVEDLDGNPRPTGPEFDIGAYESQTVLALEEDDNEVHDLEGSRWLRGYLVGRCLFVEGIQPGNDVSIFNYMGQLVESHAGDINGLAIIPLEDYLPGQYVAVMHHGHEIDGTLSFQVID